MIVIKSIVETTLKVDMEYDITYLNSNGDKAIFTIREQRETGFLDEVVSALLEPFMMVDPIDKDEIAFEVIKKYDKECQEYFNQIFSKFSKRFAQIQQLKKFLHTISEDEYFACIPPNKAIEQEVFYEVIMRLRSLNNGENYEELKARYDEVLKPVLDLYEVTVLGKRKRNIGDSRQKICRFCGKSSPEISFNNQAHAISEGIGNKNLYCLDECDSCNEKFSIELEPSLIAYLSLYRTIFGVKGNGGSKKIKTNKLHIEKKDNQVHVNMRGNLNPKIDGDYYFINLPKIGKFTPAKVYKTLVKYFLSLIDNRQLENFKNTIEWINGDLEYSGELPKIAATLRNQDYIEQPELSIFIRKVQTSDLPYAFAELRFTILRYVFIIPFSSQDKREFLKDEEYSIFWQELKHYDYFEWKFEDFSKTKEYKLDYKLKFDLNDIRPIE